MLDLKGRKVFTEAAGHGEAASRRVEAVRARSDLKLRALRLQASRSATSNFARPGFKILDEGWKFGAIRRAASLGRAGFVWKFVPAQMASALRAFNCAPPTV
jgi:hypothetical protein